MHMATRLFLRSLMAVVLIAVAMGVIPVHNSSAFIEVTIGNGTAASCLTSDAADAFDAAVSAGGEIIFSCGPDPLVIPIHTAYIDKQVTVNGGSLISLSGEDLRQLFIVYGSGWLTLNDLTLQDGHAQQGGAIEIGPDAVVEINRSFLVGNSATSQGGAIYNEGTLNIFNSTLSGNSAFDGGGLMNTSCFSTSCLNGWALISDSTFSDNSATWGAGLYNSEATAIISTSTFSSNVAISGGGGILSCYSTLSLSSSTLTKNSGEQGGAIANCGQAEVRDSAIWENSASYGGGINNGTGSLTLINSTLSSNTADIEGGGLYNEGGATINNSTLSGNLALNGGGLFSTGNYSNLTLNNSLIANSSGGGDCVKTGTTSASHTLIEESSNACGLIDGIDGNIIGQDPKLGPLQDNGGPTWTHALLTGSPAIDAGDDALAAGLENDQRGAGFPRIAGTAVDMGAFEAGTQEPAPASQVFLPFISRL